MHSRKCDVYSNLEHQPVCESQINSYSNHLCSLSALTELTFITFCIASKTPKLYWWTSKAEFEKVVFPLPESLETYSIHLQELETVPFIRKDIKTKTSKMILSFVKCELDIPKSPTWPLTVASDSEIF